MGNLSIEDTEQVLSVFETVTGAHTVSVDELCDAVRVLGTLADIGVTMHKLLLALREHSPVAWQRLMEAED